MLLIMLLVTFWDGLVADTHAAGFIFHPAGGLLRSKLIDRLYDLKPEARQLLLSYVPLTCADGSAGDVIVFDFVANCSIF